jgi:hypothetical protein
MSRKISRLAGLAAAVAIWVAPGLASAHQPVAAVTMYEVAEAMSFKGSQQGSPTRRLADATLLGNKIVPLTTDPASPWANAEFITAFAQSDVSLATGKGPIVGTFNLLKDVDPTRESLDTLVIANAGSVYGVLDLSTATLGYAATSGTWQLKTSKGTFAGLFVVPFPYGDGYVYLDPTDSMHLDQLGVSFCDSTRAVVLPDGTKACLLGSEEFALGIPLTKVVLILSR